MFQLINYSTVFLHEEMTSVNAITQQNPSVSDTIMASALLAFSRNNTGANDTAKSCDAESSVRDFVTTDSLFVDSKAKTTQIAPKIIQNEEFTTDCQFNIASKGATLNHLMSTSALTQPIESHVKQLARLRAAVIQDQTNVVAMYNGAFFNSPITFAMPRTSEETHNSGSELSAEQTSIRQKEIEKALRSKPQRGRKRANLNEIERLELTRTRNREHAKSTRIRKKMRYEELLDCETRIKVIEERQDLEHRRRLCVVKYLSFRETMIRELTLTKSVDSDLPLKIMRLFQENANTLYDDGSADNKNFTTLECMQKFDRSLLSGINIAANKSVISYKMKDPSGLHDIALSQNGTAIVEADLVSDNIILQSHVLKITFARECDQIRSVVILPLACSHTTHFDSPSVVNERHQNLEEQISYPSVVSFDVEKDNRKRVISVEEKRCESDDGIGMPF